MGTLQQAISAVCDGSSLYWAFYEPDNGKADRGIVEVRLNASVDDATNFFPTTGWIVERIQWDDAIFFATRAIPKASSTGGDACRGSEFRKRQWHRIPFVALWR